MVRRRAKSAGITAMIGNHTFRGTGITAYLKNGGTVNAGLILGQGDRVKQGG